MELHPLFKDKLREPARALLQKLANMQLFSYSGEIVEQKRQQEILLLRGATGAGNSVGLPLVHHHYFCRQLQGGAWFQLEACSRPWLLMVIP